MLGTFEGVPALVTFSAIFFFLHPNELNFCMCDLGLNSGKHCPEIFSRSLFLPAVLPRVANVCFADSIVWKNKSFV